ncbi:hypothetical protein LTR36_002921 [Oleoguttula mirabilis]|uniref:RRM domain-containing protein n=1 Tax=Oleoguttula mirabilis TaxID=1507867 RepID=A0AAV9JK76_9PEZI|nr:hypothetical protein LTR36_002921 [Oleoguttula mirabilis]
MADILASLEAELALTAHPTDDRDYPPARDRSRSPVADRDGDSRIRDEPSNGRDSRDNRDNRDNRGPPAHRNGGDEDDESVNPGSNLFVTGIHPRLTEDEVTRLFEKYGQVEKTNIMRDPHTRESRGFGFVKMVTGEEADAAKDGLQGEVYEGRTLSIEKARRAKPRTPTPGKYFGPPKRDDAPPRRGYRDRYDDRGPPRRDDRRGGGSGGGYRDRYDDRGSSYGRRDEYAPRVDRYASGGREDRYGGGGGGERRGGGYGGGSSYDRPSRGPPPESGAYGGRDAGAAGDAPPPRGGAGYEDRRRTYD